MGGSKKKTAEESLPYPASKWMGEARDLRSRRAQEFEDESKERISRGREFVESSLYRPPREQKPFAERLTESSYGRGREQYGQIAEGGVTGTSYGRGRETYADLASTGGFTPESTALFMRSATSPFASIYSTARRELERRRAVQGGYSPTFGAEGEKLTRRTAQDISEGTMRARAELERQKREGRIEGAGGLERTREAAGREYLEGVGGLERTREAAGQEARGQQEIEQGQEQLELERVALAQQGLNQQDVLRLQSRLQSGALDNEDIKILAAVRENAPSLFQQIMQGIQIGAGVASSAMTGGLSGALEQVGKGCWIAAKIYGYNTPQFHAARNYILFQWRGKLSKVVFKLYLKYGKILAQYNWIIVLKPLFDIAVRRGNAGITNS